MSALATYETTMTDPKILQAALESLGYTVTAAPGRSGDMTIQSKPGMPYMNARALLKGGVFHLAGDEDYLTQDVTGRIRQAYAEHRTIGLAKAKGYQFLGRDVIKTASGREEIKLRFMQR